MNYAIQLTKPGSERGYWNITVERFSSDIEVTKSTLLSYLKNEAIINQIKDYLYLSAFKYNNHKAVRLMCKDEEYKCGLYIEG